MDSKAIIEFLDNHLTKLGLKAIGPVEANVLLEKAGILADSKDRPGSPLRKLMRKGQRPHTFQSEGKCSSWSIPHSRKQSLRSSIYQSKSIFRGNGTSGNSIPKVPVRIDISVIKKTN